jgi:hypothetical protein
MRLAGDTPKRFSFFDGNVFRSVLRLNALRLWSTPIGFSPFSSRSSLHADRRLFAQAMSPRRERPIAGARERTPEIGARSTPIYPIANRRKNRTEKWRLAAILREIAV